MGWFRKFVALIYFHTFSSEIVESVLQIITLLAESGDVEELSVWATNSISIYFEIMDEEASV